MSVGADHDLVPLGPGFDITKRGYNRMQVDEHLEQVQKQMDLLAADRNNVASQADDLARQLESNRSENAELRGQVERLSLPPTTLEGLSERLQRMLRLAQDEAGETKARAEAEAGHIRAKAEADGNELRQRYDKLLADLDARKVEMEAEHRGVLEQARDEAAMIARQSEDERMRADAEAKQRRTQIEEDFEIAMASRRTESMRALAEQEATSKGEAERRVREATDEAAKRRADAIAESTARVKEAADEARRRVSEATDEANRRITHAAQRVTALRQLRTKVADQLNAARDLIADAHLSLEKAAPALDPLPDERSEKPAAAKAEAEAAGPPKEHWEPDLDPAAPKPAPSPRRPAQGSVRR
jgi:cell division septum initiation protein DivIVA